MCELAPLQQKCRFEKYRCLFCESSRLQNSIHEVLRSVPLFERYVVPLPECNQFECVPQKSIHNESE